MSTEASERCTGWQFPELREVGEIVTGSTPPKARKELYGGSFPFVKPGELLHCPVYESEDCLSEEGAKVADVAPAGSILVSCIGNLGKTGLALSPVAFNQQINAVIPRNPDESKWIFYAVQSPKFAEELAAVSSATTIAIVNKRKFSSLRIPVAPFPEQQRIVEEIEKQFTRLDAGVAALRRVQANLKRYRAAVLKAACEGELVPTEAELHQSPGEGQKGFESGEQLLKRILAERRQRWTGRGQYKEPAAPVTSDLSEPPKGWGVVSLEQLTSATRPICYGILMPKENVSTGVLFVRVKDIKGDKIDLEGLHRTTPEIAEKYARASLKTGDLLLSIRGTYGRIAEVPKELEGGNITQDTARLDVTPLVNHRYVATCLRNPGAQNYFKRVARGVAVKGVNIGDVRPMPILLPPLAEQTRIVAEVERRLSVVEELESVVSANLQRANRLRQSILQKAFTGKLTS